MHATLPTLPLAPCRRVPCLQGFPTVPHKVGTWAVTCPTCAFACCRATESRVPRESRDPFVAPGGPVARTSCVPTCPETTQRGPCPPPAPPVLSQRAVRTYRVHPRPPLRGVRESRARPLLAPLPLLSCTPPAPRTTRPSHRAADFAAGSHVSEHRLRTLCFRSSPPAGPYTARAT